jgi:hypothetical protein
MPRKRTVRSLTVLFVSMTIGAVALILMETEPLQPTAPSLAALAPDVAGPAAAVFDLEDGVEFQRLKWRNIVIHSSAGGPADIGRRCHFLIRLDKGGKAKAAATPLWQRQAKGDHVRIPGRDFDAISVGICLVGEFSVQPPARAQYEALVALVRALQREFGVTADHIYLHSDLVPNSPSPGRAFPANHFSRHLATP